MGRRRPLPSARVYASHVLRRGAIFLGFIGAALGLGMVGYRYIFGLDWSDALLNASMILTGMGPVAPATTLAGKLFASAYALFSGVFFLSATAFLLAPVAQHFLHRFHLEMYGDEGEPLPDGGPGRGPGAKAAPVKSTAAKAATSKEAASKEAAPKAAAQSAASSKPAPGKSAESKPAQSKSTDSKSADSKSTESKQAK